MLAADSVCRYFRSVRLCSGKRFDGGRDLKKTHDQRTVDSFTLCAWQRHLNGGCLGLI